MRIQLGEILHIQKGKKPQSQSTEALDGYLPYVDIKAFERGIIDNYASTEKSLLCEDGDLLIVCDGSRSGLTGRAIKGVVGSTLAKISADGLTTEYLRYFIQSKYTLLNTQKKGTGTPHLNIEILKSSEITVPSVTEQDRIVSHIEELFSELDKAVETLQTTKKQLAVYRQAVLNETFDFVSNKKTILHKLTDDIRIGPFGTSLHKSDYIQNGIPVINPQHIKNHSITKNSKTTITVEKAKELAAYRFKTNDIVMGRRGEMGRTAPITARENGWVCGTGSILIRLKPQYDATLYSKFLSSPDSVRYLKENSTGTTMDNLNEEIVKSIPVPIISKKIQRKIEDKLNQRLSTCDSIEKTVDNALQQAEGLRQSILKKAFEEGL